MDNTTGSNSFESVCKLCMHFYPNSGYCSKIKLNVRKNPQSFFEKCDVKFFVNIKEPYSSRLRFKTLLILGKLIYFFGWIIVVASAIFIFISLVQTFRTNDISLSDIIIIISGIVIFINGILVVCVGQLISCFVSIEHNTYEISNFIKSMHVFKNKNIQ